MNSKLKWKQSNDDENLAVCIASVALFYNINIPFYKITQMLPECQDKKSISMLTPNFEQLGFKSKVVSSEWNIKSLTWPLLALYAEDGKNERFVIVYKKTSQWVTIMDPAVGEFIKMKNYEFAKNFKGLIVFFIPLETIDKYRKATNLQRFWYLLQTHKAKLVQSFIGTLAEIILELTSIVYVLKIVDFVLTDGNTNLLNLMSISMIVLLMFRIILNVCRKLIILKVGTNIDARLTLAYYNQLISLPKMFFHSNKNGDLTSRIYDVNEITNFTTTIIQQMILNFLFITFSLLFMMFYSWKLTLTVVVCLFLYLCLYAFYKKTSEIYFRRFKENYSDFYAHFTESLSSVDTIKNFTAKRHFSLTAENKYFEFLKTKYKTSVINIILENSTELISGVAIIIIMWLGSLMVINHSITPGALISFYVLLGYLFTPAKNLVYSNYSAQLALTATDRLFEIMEIEPEENEKPGIILPKGYTGEIRVNNISFHYGTNKMLFENLSLKFEAGKTTAIVGESGSGKTTLVSLIQKLYTPNKGTIYYGDYNLANVDTTSLRQLIGVVPQKVDLFAGTIADNIALGQVNPDMKKIADLCKLVGINRHIETLDEGYNSQVGEQGIMLSGGEKQRIAIVRALYHDPEIIILDEATSALDSGSETYIKNVIRLLRKRNKTIIIIAHRLSTIMEADKIIVLKHGELVEEGSHQQLMHIKQNYYRMWMYQFPRFGQDLEILGKRGQAEILLRPLKESEFKLDKELTDDDDD